MKHFATSFDKSLINKVIINIIVILLQQTANSDTNTRLQEDEEGGNFPRLHYKTLKFWELVYHRALFSAH